jgi:hypothetical protein
MTPEYQAVRNFAVTGLVRHGRPLTTREMASSVKLSVSRVEEIAAELERRLFFLVRNRSEEVAWTFPITADPTPHEMRLSTGERIYGACAEDSFAAPFVLGKFLRCALHAEIHTVCGQSRRKLRLIVASDRTWRVETKAAQVLLFIPGVNWEEFRGENIIDDY